LDVPSWAPEAVETAALTALREDTRPWWGAAHDPDKLEEDLSPTRSMWLACFSNFKDL
jgi:hypothetical protein